MPSGIASIHPSSRASLPPSCPLSIHSLRNARATAVAHGRTTTTAAYLPLLSASLFWTPFRPRESKQLAGETPSLYSPRRRVRAPTSNFHLHISTRGSYCNYHKSSLAPLSPPPSSYPQSPKTRDVLLSNQIFSPSPPSPPLSSEMDVSSCYSWNCPPYPSSSFRSAEYLHVRVCMYTYVCMLRLSSRH